MVEDEEEMLLGEREHGCRGEKENRFGRRVREAPRYAQKNEPRFLAFSGFLT
jgi:hypothetical protein